MEILDWLTQQEEMRKLHTPPARKHNGIELTVMPSEEELRSPIYLILVYKRSGWSL